MKSFLTLFAFICALTCYAQNTTVVSGQVFYEEDKEPVPFAYVKLKGIAFGTVTDYDGTFKLKVPERYQNEILEFSYLGYKTYEFAIANYSEPLKIYLESQPTELYTVVVTAKRESNPKAILRKALNQVPELFVDEPFSQDGFYREYVKENDRPVKYADASFILDLKGYSGKMEKKKAYEAPDDFSGATTIGSFVSRSSSMHRWHFHQKVLKGEKAKIIDSKSSDDLNSTRLYANIQGGPLSALTKDKVKYPSNFMSNFAKYEYALLSVEQDGKPYFLINFKPKLSVEKYKKKKRSYNHKYKLGGSILINKENYAIEEVNYSVPPEYKQFICGYRGWSIRHFDFSVKAKYEETPTGYALSYLRHTDEFIVEDTISDRKIPYIAVSEFYSHQTKIGQTGIKKEENFSNSDYNYLFDLPEEYNEDYWKGLEKEYPHTKIPTDLYVSLSSVTPLEKQFRSKLIRDTTLPPPTAAVQESAYFIHGKTVKDGYSWLKDTKNPLGNEEVMQYLAAENNYTNNYFKPLKPLSRDIFREIKSYVQDDFTSLPVKKNGYKYYYRYYPNKEHRVYFREKLNSDSTKAEILFDVNKMAVGKGFYLLTGVEISPDNSIAAFMENTTGKDRWVLKFKDLNTGKILNDSVEYVATMQWVNNQQIAFTEAERKTYRTSKLYEYSLETKQKKLIYEERDRTFSIDLTKSRSEDFLFMNTASNDENEVHFLRLGNPDVGWKMVSPRVPDQEYQLAHFEDRFYILTNKKAINNKVMVADTSDYEEKSWKTFIPHNDEIEIVDVVPFKNWMVYNERHGLDYKVKVVSRSDGKAHYIKQNFKDAIFLADNPEFDTDTLQIRNTNYKLASRVRAYDMARKKTKTLKVEGGFSPVFFASQKTVYAPARDGEKVPITLLYLKKTLKSLEKEGKKPKLLINGYGAYGSRNIPGYLPDIYPLLQKGFVYAIAHVRGGGDLGEKWYQEGRMLKKKNSFYDFIDCTEYLIEEGYAEKGEIVAEGGSAGGLLMGAVVNMRPDLYKLIILDVPFVDVVNTMLDDQLPLTTGEYDEWGNPNEKKYFKYISSYSPYENVKAQDYPMLYFTTAINDTRVGYWEPAKMVARLRSLKTDQYEILFRIDFSSGHGGASGRYAALSQTAFKSALIIDTLLK